MILRHRVFLCNILKVMNGCQNDPEKNLNMKYLKSQFFEQFSPLIDDFKMLTRKTLFGKMTWNVFK